MFRLKILISECDHVSSDKLIQIEKRLKENGAKFHFGAAPVALCVSRAEAERERHGLVRSPRLPLPRSTWTSDFGDYARTRGVLHDGSECERKRR